MATSLQTIRRLTVEGRTVGVNEATASLTALSRAQTTVAQTAEGMAVATDTSAKRQLSAARSYDGVRAKVDEAYRAQVQYQRMQATVDKAFSQGAIQQQEYARTSALVAQRFGLSGQAANDNARKIGLNANEMKNLGFQLNDVGTMLASGSSPLQVMATQSGQVYQILAGSNGGVTGAVKDLGARLVAFLGPLGLVAVGFTAVAGAAYAFYALTKKEAPTSEKLLEEHDRLLKVVRDSYDKVTGATKNWYEQSKEVTHLQLLQQEIDLRTRLTQETIKGLKTTVEIPIGGSVARIKDEYKAFSDAIYTLNEAWQQGTPNVQAFQQEIAKIALANPELRKLANDLIASMGDASKLSGALQRNQDMLKGLQSGTFTADQRGRLGLADPTHQVSAYQQLIDRTRDRIEQLNLEADVAGRASDAVLRLRLQHEAERAAKKAGIEINQKVLDQLKEELSLAERRRAIANVRSEIEFDRRTIGLSDEDVQIAERLRTIYGNDIPAALNSSEASAMRFNSRLRQGFDFASSSAKDFGVTLAQALNQGKSLTDALSAAVNQLSQRMMTSGVNNMLEGLFSGNLVQMAGGALQAGVGYLLGGGDRRRAREEQRRREEEENRRQNAAIQERRSGFNQRHVGAGLTDGSLATELIRFQLDANRQMVAEQAAGGQAMDDLMSALSSERLAKVKDFAKAAREALAGDTLSGIAKRMKEIDDAAANLRTALSDLGAQSGVTAEEIDNGVRAAMAKLRSDFVGGIEAAINDATGFGYRNQIADLLKDTKQKRDDALLLGADPALIDRYFAVQAQKIVEDANLVGTAFDDLLAVFPELRGVVHSATNELTDFFESLDKNIEDFIKRSRLGTNSVLSPQEQFAEAQRQYQTQLALAQGGDRDALSGITQIADSFLNIARGFLGPSAAFGTIFNAMMAELEALRGQGPGMEAGGVVGNGIWNRDSVVARYAGGGNIALAGGEGVLNARATAAIGGRRSIDFINRSGVLPGNDNSALVAELRAMRAELAESRAERRQLIAALVRMLADGNAAAADVLRELGGLRLDTRQAADEKRVRSKSAA
jgi:hypothetical protein